MTKIQEAVVRLKALHGSYRKVEAVTGINYAYLQRLATKEHTEPSDQVLALLGLEKRVTYVRKVNGSST